MLRLVTPPEYEGVDDSWRERIRGLRWVRRDSRRGLLLDVLRADGWETVIRDERTGRVLVHSTGHATAAGAMAEADRS